MSAAEAATPTPADALPGVGAQLAALGRDIKLAHSVFALPFAVLAMVLAAAWAQRWPSAIEVGLILLCMVAARTFAMTANRLADARFDAANPRTANRAIPAGALSRRTAIAAIVGSAALFGVSAAGFGLLEDNWWPVALAPVVLAWLAGYSFAKRFTAWCHVWLGVALALSPVAAALAIEPGYLARPTVWWLAGFVAAWVAGFDVIYALADAAFDRGAGLRSLPGWLGAAGALWVSRALHVGAAAMLLACGVSSEALSTGFFTASILVIALLVLEHALVWNASTKRLPIAFFTVNGVISLALGAAGIVDVWLA